MIMHHLMLTHVATLNKLQETVDLQPKINDCPQYRARKAISWGWKPNEKLKPECENR